jgi:hypothetical protein
MKSFFFEDEPQQVQGISQESSSLTESNSQLFLSQPLENRITKIESVPVDEFNDEDIFMNENLHHQEYLEYHQQPIVKKIEEYDQPQHSRVHTVQAEAQNYQQAMALKPRNEGTHKNSFIKKSIFRTTPNSTSPTSSTTRKSTFTFLWFKFVFNQICQNRADSNNPTKNYRGTEI